jgi:uncharacterized protein YutE (UPF0331/DUF86 family)
MPNRINIERIKQFVGEVKEALRVLRAYLPKGKEEILKNPTILGSAKYHLIVAIQGCIDICNHLVAKEGGRAPEDYADCFTLMADLGILKKDLSDRLAQMARFRNLLIHLYWRVDNERVYKILNENLVDIDQFLGSVGKILQKTMNERSSHNK